MTVAPHDGSRCTTIGTSTLHIYEDINLSKTRIIAGVVSEFYQQTFLIPSTMDLDSEQHEGEPSFIGIKFCQEW